MTARDAYRIWAPAGTPWAGWVRPVPFAAADDPPGAVVTANFAAPDIVYIAGPQKGVALIVDKPGPDGVPEGIALAKMGFRPIPLYNGTNGQQNAMALLDNRALENALLWGAGELERIVIPPNAPPAFLLDSNRTHRYRMDAAVFDNSWDIYDQDMPPADYLLQNGIRRIVVRGESIQKDLRRILFKYQKKGVAISLTDGYRPPRALTLRKPMRK